MEYINMGYESRIYIVEKTTSLNCDNGKYFALEIARFALGKVRYISNYLREKPVTNCYIYADDDNTQIVEDKYGSPLTECTPEDLITLINQSIANAHLDRLYYPLLVFLESIVKNPNYWPNVVCLHYGY